MHCSTCSCRKPGQSRPSAVPSAGGVGSAFSIGDRVREVTASLSVSRRWGVRQTDTPRRIRACRPTTSLPRGTHHQASARAQWLEMGPAE